MQNVTTYQLCLCKSQEAQNSQAVFHHILIPGPSVTYCACVKLACVAVLWFHFVLAEAGSVSAPCKLKSRIMVVVLSAH